VKKQIPYTNLFLKDLPIYLREREHACGCTGVGGGTEGEGEGKSQADSEPGAELETGAQFQDPETTTRAETKSGTMSPPPPRHPSLY